MQNENFFPQNNSLLMDSELKVYARIVWRWLWLILLCTVAAGIVAYIVSIYSTDIYQAQSSVLISVKRGSGTDTVDIWSSERTARTYAQLMTRNTTKESVAESMGVNLEEFNASITNVNVTPVRDTQLIRVTVEGIEPQAVTWVANNLPQEFIAEIRATQTEKFAETKASLQQQLDELTNQIDRTRNEIVSFGDSTTAQEEVALGRLNNSLTQYENNYSRALQSFENVRLEEVRSTDDISLVEPAVAPVNPIRPRVLINTLLASIVGAMMALGAIFLMEYLDDRIKSPRELMSIARAPLLGAVTRIPQAIADKSGSTNTTSLITIREPRNPISESYRGIRTNLQFANVDSNIKSLIVTSAVPNEGKTTTAANLAIVMAQSGMKVAVVDADLRKPSQHKIFGIPAKSGLMNALFNEGVSPLRFAAQGSIPNLSVIPCGKRPPNPSEIIGSQRMRNLVQQLQQEVDIVIFDAPPLLAVTDAQILATQVDGVLLVVKQGTEKGAVARAAESLEQVNARLLGMVMNNMRRTASDEYYYYEYYYTENDDGNEISNEVMDTLKTQPVAHYQASTAQPVVTNGDYYAPQNGQSIGMPTNNG